VVRCASAGLLDGVKSHLGFARRKIPGFSVDNNDKDVNVVSIWQKMPVNL
jgi:hypothetical protein